MKIYVCLFIYIIFLGQFLSISNSISKETVSTEELEKRVAAFNKWYHEFNPNSKNLEARLDKDGRIKLYSTENIKQESELISANKSQFITYNDIYETKYGEVLKEVEETYGFDDYVNIALTLLIEKNNPESKWKPYLDILPATPHSLLWNYWDNKVWVEAYLENTSIPSKLYYIISNRKNI